MTSSAWALQAALHGALAGDAPLVAALGGTPKIYDEVPQGTATPYLAFAEWQVSEADTGDARLDSHAIVLRAWSPYGGLKRVKELASLIENAVHGASLELEDHALIDIAFTGAAFLKDERERLSIAEVRFRALTEANSE